MASRNIEIVIAARDRFSGTANKVIGSLNKMDSAAGRVGKGVGQMGAGFARAGVAVGAFAVTGLGAAAKAAIEWEDAFAGVRKTVDETDLTKAGLSFEKLERQFRDMATEIPVAAGDLARIGEAAGALGIKAADIQEFTRVVALIGVTTDVSTDQAATSLGQLSNVLGLTGADFDNFAATLVDLGNKGASTESQILEITARAGASAKLLGVAKAETLGWGSAIANLGIEVEAGGSSLQSFFLKSLRIVGAGSQLKKVAEGAGVSVEKLTNSILDGGKSLEKLARKTGLTAGELKKLMTAAGGLDMMAQTAGMTGKAFRQAFEKDASGALESFLRGLGKLKQAEQLNVLKELGFNDIRITRMLLGLAGNADNLTNSLNISTAAWEQNSALTVEAEKRFATIKSQLQLLRNGFMEMAITLGEGFTPALGRTASKLSSFLKMEDNRNALKQLGADIGAMIDGIDWGQVLSGARTFVEILKDAAFFAKTIFDVVNLLPTEIKAAGLGFLALNKLSGGLIAQGAGNVLGGVAELGIRSAGSRLPGAAGRLFAQPVFVTNWPIGGLGGGTDILATGGKGGLLGKILQLLPATAIAAAIVTAAVPIGEAFANALPDEWKGRPGETGMNDPERLHNQALVAAGPPTVGDFGRHGPMPVVLGPPAPVKIVIASPKSGGRSPDERGEIRALDRAKEMEAILKRGIEAGFHPTELAVQRTFDKNTQHLIDIKNAIEAQKQVKPPEVTVNVTVGAAGVLHKTIEIRRYGPTGGSRNTSGPLIFDR